MFQSDFKVLGLSNKKIETQIINFLKTHHDGWDPNSKLEMVRFIEVTLLRAFGTGILITNEIPANMEAYYDPVDNNIVVGESTYNEFIAENNRARFTLAHEAAHVILQRDQLYALALMPSGSAARQRDDFKIYESAEWQANNGAAFLLMPTDGVTTLVTEMVKSGNELVWADYYVGNFFGVSTESANVRLKKMGYRMDTP